MEKANFSVRVVNFTDLIVPACIVLIKKKQNKMQEAVNSRTPAPKGGVEE